MVAESHPPDATKPAKPKSIPHWRLIVEQAVITDDILNHYYPGSGTEDDPYVVNWIPHDPRNPMEWGKPQKWFYTMAMAVATLAVALLSSAYSGGVRQIMVEFKVGTEVATLGVSLFVL